jgi:hypothetical protein
VSLPPRPYPQHVYPKGLALGLSDTRSKVHMVNGESTSADEQEIKDVLLEEIWNRPNTVHTSFRKYITYLDKR